MGRKFYNGVYSINNIITNILDTGGYIITLWLQEKKNVAKTFSEVLARAVVENTVQALKYPSADTVTLYMPDFKSINGQ